MTSIGETLRRERLRQGLDLQQLSETTKIGTRMLHAMEADDFSKLPGGVFTRSFIRQYAAALGLEPGTLDTELKALNVAGDEGTRFESRKTESHADRAFSSFSDSGPESSSLAVSAIWVLLALLVCGGVYYLMNRTPAQTSPASEKAANPPTPEKGAAVASANRPPEPKPAIQPSAKQDQPPPAPVETPAVASVPAPVPTAPVAGLQVILSAVEPAWVSVTADGKSAYVGVLQPNEKKEITASAKVKVVAGNAGGLQITLNGRPIDSIGPKGQVRTVELTPAGAQVVSRTPNPSPLL